MDFELYGIAVAVLGFFGVLVAAWWSVERKGK